MRVLIYGECDEVGSGAWCYFRAAQNLNMNVTYYSPFTHLSFYYSFLGRVYRKLAGSVHSYHRGLHMNGLIKKATIDKPDVVIVLKGLLIDFNVILRIREMSAKVVLLNHDDFFSKFKNSRSDLQFEALPYYNGIFATKHVNVEELRVVNNNIEFLQFAYSSEIHVPPTSDLQEEIEFDSDVTFVGSCYPSRLKLLEFLAENLNPKYKISVYGRGWLNSVRSERLLECVQNRILNHQEMSKVIYYSKINIGFLCKENRDDHTQRTFEIPAIGGLLLAEDTPRHRNYYNDFVDAVFFDVNDKSDLLEKVNILLENSSMLKKIRVNGNRKVKKIAATYEDRMIHILNCLEKW